MDLMSGAGAFATIVGLLCNFSAERASGDLNQFILWLKEKQHEDVAAAIEGNKALFDQINSILSTNHEQLIQKLAALDDVLSSVAAHVQGFAGLAHAVNPQSTISSQAVSILKQLVDSGAKLFMERKIMNGTDPDEYLLMEGAHGKIAYDEPRFVEDDLGTLVALGLLRLEFASRGSRRFLVTREAAKFVSTVER